MVPTIAELRAREGWNRSELARRLGVTSQAVFYWEAGVKMPNVPHLRALARVFGVSMDEVILGADSADQPTPPESS